MAKEELVVLQVLPEMEHGGVEVGTVEIATGLQKAGIRNFVASRGGRMLYELDKIKVQHFTLPLKTKNPIQGIVNYFSLKKIIKEHGINVVHARSRAPAWSAYFAAKKCGVKFITTFHGKYKFGPLSIKKVYNKVMTYGRLIIVISEHIKKHLINDYNVDKKKLRLVHRCVNIERFSPDSISEERIINVIKSYNIPDDKKILLLNGRITRWKGHTLLLDALAKLEEKDWLCIISGSDQGRKYFVDELKEKVMELGLEDKVKFIGFCSDIPALLSVSDVVFSTAIEPEAFGRASIEAQAMGKIIIASNHGGSLENIVDGITGRLYENKNPDALASAIRWAFKLTDSQKKIIAKAAQKNVEDNFSVDAMCKKTIDVYKELIKLKD
ncbi:MAG: glycosyltransferase family 4 protein [Alphaproteobacteria bacterium]